MQDKTFFIILDYFAEMKLLYMLVTESCVLSWTFVVLASTPKLMQSCKTCLYVSVYLLLLLLLSES